MSEATDLLRDIAATLARIEILLAKTPKSRRPKTNTGNRYTKMIAEQREQTQDPTPIDRTLELWAEVCPSCPAPVVVDLDRRLILREFWQKMGGEDGVRSLFEIVDGNDWLSGRPVPGPQRTTRKRPRGPITLFEVVRNHVAIVEGSFS